MRLLLFLLLVSTRLSAQTTEMAAVRKTFDTYKAAIMSSDGKKAASCIGAKTLAYYTRMAVLVRTADSAAVAAMPLTDRLVVFHTRLTATPAEIAGFDGQSLFTYSVDKGTGSKKGVTGSTIGKVTIQGATARGLLLKGGNSAGFFDFIKEKGSWKIDLTKAIGAGEMALRGIVEESGKAENELLFFLIGRMAGKQPDNSIWHPVTAP